MHMPVRREHALMLAPGRGGTVVEARFSGIG
jgi:hypothetical protein